MRNSDFGGRSYLPPGNGPLNYGHDSFCLPARYFVPGWR